MIDFETLSAFRQSIQEATMSEPALTGSCQCKHITYSSTSLPTHFTNCYCLTCRKVSGAPFVAFGGFPTSAITWISGYDTLTKTSYSKFAERAHCAKCGTPIYMSYKFRPENISITSGSIDEESIKGELPKAVKHIFVEEKAPWYELPDDKLPRYQQYPPEFQKMVDEFMKV